VFFYVVFYGASNNKWLTDMGENRTYLRTNPAEAGAITIPAFGEEEFVVSQILRDLYIRGDL